MRESLFIYIGTEDSRSENALAKLKVMKEVLRSVKEILWPTNGREANVLDAVRLAVFRISRSDVFKLSNSITYESNADEECICNCIFECADVTESDKVEGNDVENKDERLFLDIANVLNYTYAEFCESLNDFMGIVGTDSKGNIAVGTTSGTFASSVPKNGSHDVYINAAIRIGHGPTIMRFNVLEVAICKARTENISLQDAIEEAGKMLSIYLEATNCAALVTETGKHEFYMNSKRKIWAGTYGENLLYCMQFTEEF